MACWLADGLAPNFVQRPGCVCVLLAEACQRSWPCNKDMSTEHLLTGLSHAPAGISSQLSARLLSLAVKADRQPGSLALSAKEGYSMAVLRYSK